MTDARPRADADAAQKLAEMSAWGETVPLPVLQSVLREKDALTERLRLAEAVCEAVEAFIVPPRHTHIGLDGKPCNTTHVGSERRRVLEAALDAWRAASPAL